MEMQPLLDPREFYEATLLNEGIEIEPEDLTKVAEAHEMDLETAKLARAYFEQLQLDGVQYESESARFGDAVKMAKAYFDHAVEAHVEARKIADGILGKVTESLRDYAEGAGLEDVPLSELLLVASKQAESAEAWAAEQAEKIATLDFIEHCLEEAKKEAEAAKEAEGEEGDGEKEAESADDPAEGSPKEAGLGAGDLQGWWTGPEQHPAHLAPETFGNAARMLKHQGPPEEARRFLAMRMGIDDPNHPDVDRSVHNLGVAAQQHIQQHGSLDDIASLINARGQIGQPAGGGVGGWIKSNPGKSLGIAAAGAGGAYLLHRHLQNKKRERQEAELARLRAQAMPA